MFTFWMQLSAQGWGKSCPSEVGIAEAEIHVTQQLSAMPPRPLGSRRFPRSCEPCPVVGVCSSHFPKSKCLPPPFLTFWMFHFCFLWFTSPFKPLTSFSPAPKLNPNLGVQVGFSLVFCVHAKKASEKRREYSYSALHIAPFLWKRISQCAWENTRGKSWSRVKSCWSAPDTSL